jgi:hypothetical protein
MIKNWAAMEAQLDKVMMSYTSPSNSLNMMMNQKELQIQNALANNISTKVSIGNSSAKAEVSLPDSLSYCDIIKQSLRNKGQSTENVNCSSVSLIQKTALGSVAVVGSNGRESNVGSSKTVTVSFFQSTRDPLDVSSLSQPLSIWIPRSSTDNIQGFLTLKASYVSSLACTYNDIFLQTSITTTTSGSIHIQFKTRSEGTRSVGYLVLLKFGLAPKLNSSYSDFDLWQVYCSNDTTAQLEETFFLFFVNVSTVNGRSGFVGIAFRELSKTETSQYCVNQKSIYNLTSPPIVMDGSTVSVNASSNSTGGNCKMISSDLDLRIYQSGCYYMDTSDGSYKSDGTEVLADTNIHSTHCQVTHCTEFAGGFVVLPTPINFEEVFANASIDRNPIIYATVFTIIGLYVILAVVCRILDMRDNKKKGITMLNGDKMENLYEVIVFTGNRKDASTESNVHMIINGATSDSHIIRFNDSNRKLFRRSGVDTFIISAQK